MKFIKVIGISFCFLLILGGNAYANTPMSKNATGVSGEYSDPNSIPSTIWYDDGTYRGTLSKTGYYQTSGSPGKKLIYQTGEIEEVAYDLCIWSSSDYTMYYQGTFDTPGGSKEVEVEGYRFTAYKQVREDGVTYTKYAAGDMDPYRGKDNRPDEPWIGSLNVVNGRTYTTAYRYYFTYWYGEYNKPDDRKYKGDYSGTVYLYAPDITGTEVKNYAYNNGNDYWFKKDTTVETQVVAKDDYVDLMNVYTHIKQSGNMKYATGATFTGGWEDGNADGKDVNFKYINSYIHSDNPNSKRLRRFVFQFKSLKEGDYDFFAHAINTKWIWARGLDQGEGIDSGLNIRIDGAAPIVSFYPEDEDWTNSEIKVNTYVSDERSGVKAWEYRTSSNNGDSYGNWISIDPKKDSYEIKLSSQGKWMIQVRATDNVGNSNIITSGPYKIDKTAPGGTFTPNSSALSILEQKVTFKPSDEGGSGVDYWEYSISRDNGETWDYEGRYYGDSQEEILLTDIAKCKIQVTIKDKAENTGIVTSGTYNIVVPDPLNGKLEMKKYDFQEYEDLNGNGEKDINEPLKPVYWVKPESEFRIYTEGYFPSSYGIYPTRSYVLYARDGKVDLSNSARQYSEEEDWGTDGDEYSDYFYNLDNGGLDFSHKDDKNYISHTHVAEATEKSHGNHFKLFYISSFFHGPIDEYHSDYKDSGIWLNVDGKPPTGNGLVEIDYKTLNMTITANDIKDSDSGVNSVWAMIFPYDPDSTSENDVNINDFDGDTEYKNSDKMKKKLIRESNGNYKFELNAYDDAFKSEMVKVVICAKDNVGNKSIIKEENVDLFTLNARIVPLNNMDYNSNNPPTLEEGQAAVLIMEVTGEVERLDIEFHHDLSEKDGTLNKTITLNPLEKYKRVDNNFIVPLYCGEDRYIVEVVAHRKSKERYASPEFIVSDSVLNGIKTRIR